MLAGLCFVAAADVRRHERLVSVLVAALALWAVAGAAMLIWGEIDRPVTVLGIDTSIQTIVWGGILFEGGLAVLYAVASPPRVPGAVRHPLSGDGPVPDPGLARRGGVGPPMPRRSPPSASR